MPKLSIISINYNNAVGLERTIKSVTSQEFKDFEYIIIDGASTDESVSIIKKNEAHISQWISEPDTGVYQAMNKGIEKSTGQYLLFLNSGDTLFSKTVLQDFTKQVDGTKGIYYGNLLFVSDTSEEIVTYPSTLSFSHFLKRSLPHPASLIRRELFNTVFLYNEDFKIVSDWEFFFCAICKHNASYEYIDIVVSNFMMDGISNDIENQSKIAEEKRTSIKNHFPLFVDAVKNLAHYDALVSSTRFSLLEKLENNKNSHKFTTAALKALSLLFLNKDSKKQG